MLAASTVALTIVSLRFNFSTGTGTDVSKALRCEEAKPGVTGVFAPTQAELLSAIAFPASLALVLSARPSPVDASNGDEARGRDASVEGCREDGDLGLFCRIFGLDADIVTCYKLYSTCS